MGRTTRSFRLLFLLGLLGALSLYLLQARWFWKLFYPWPYRAEITAAAERYRLDSYLVAALIKVESNFDPRACSEAGARGLMQVMPRTGAWAARAVGITAFSPEQLYQPEVNLLVGCWYLRHLLDEFEGNLVAALAAYNAGRGNVHAWLRAGRWQGTLADLEKIPFPETAVYVRMVLRCYQVYKFLYSRP